MSDEKFDLLDERYGTYEALLANAELVTRDVYVKRCERLSFLVNTDCLVKRGLVKLLFMEKGLKETKQVQTVVMITEQDLTDDGIRLVSNGLAPWLSVRLDAHFPRNATDTLTLLTKREDTTKSFVAICERYLDDLKKSKASNPVTNPVTNPPNPIHTGFAAGLDADDDIYAAPKTSTAASNTASTVAKPAPIASFKSSRLSFSNHPPNNVLSNFASSNYSLSNFTFGIPDASKDNASKGLLHRSDNPWKPRHLPPDPA